MGSGTNQTPGFNEMDWENAPITGQPGQPGRPGFQMGWPGGANDQPDYGSWAGNPNAQPADGALWQVSGGGGGLTPGGFPGQPGSQIPGGTSIGWGNGGQPGGWGVGGGGGFQPGQPGVIGAVSHGNPGQPPQIGHYGFDKTPGDLSGGMLMPPTGGGGAHVMPSPISKPTPVSQGPNGFAHADRGSNFGKAANWAKQGKMGKAKAAIESGGGTWGGNMHKFLKGRK